jgi:DNA-binding transcriptional MerR regulator
MTTQHLQDLQDTPRVYSAVEVAALLGVTPWQVRTVHQRGLLPPPARAGLPRVIFPADLPALRRALQKAGYLPGAGEDE